jgi:hypothetical protein
MRRFAWLILILAAVLATAQPAGAGVVQAASLDVTVDRTEVTVGQRIVVSVLLRLPETSQPDLADLEQQFGDLDVLVIGLPVEQSIGGGVKEIRTRYEVAAFALGGTQVPALTIPFVNADGSSGAVTSAAIPVNVLSVIPPGADAAEIRDLKPQIALPFNAGVSRNTVLAAAGARAAMTRLAAAGMWWLWRRQRPAAAPVVVGPAGASPDSVARAELDRIAALGLIEQGDLVTFHALLAACVRRYLSERYDFPAFAMTTSELRTRMEQFGVGRGQARRYNPAPARAESNLSMAYEIVALTTEESMAPVAASS